MQFQAFIKFLLAGSEATAFWLRHLHCPIPKRVSVATPWVPSVTEQEAGSLSPSALDLVTHTLPIWGATS